jgi:hypothetical protein
MAWQRWGRSFFEVTAPLCWVAVQTGVQSRSELTFKDKTMTRLGEMTIFSVGEGPRTIDLGSGQFLLYVPKKAGGMKVKTGSVTAAITG